MLEPAVISVFVKLRYWDVYRLSVALTAMVLRKILYIWAGLTLLFFAFAVFSLVRGSPDIDWLVSLQHSDPIKWALAVPVLMVFVLPLLSARRILREERIKRGVGYSFSDVGIHVETCVSKADLSWHAIQRIIETRSAFLMFTTPIQCCQAPIPAPTAMPLQHSAPKTSPQKSPPP